MVAAWLGLALCPFHFGGRWLPVYLDTTLRVSHKYRSSSRGKRVRFLMLNANQKVGVFQDVFMARFDATGVIVPLEIQPEAAGASFVNGRSIR